MAVARFRRWWRRRKEPDRVPDLRDHDPELEHARRRLTATTRLVSINSSKSARALKKLNRLLMMRARALESIGAAESALASMDEAHDE